MRSAPVSSIRPRSGEELAPPRLNPSVPLSLLLLAGILLTGPCLLGAVQPQVELPLLLAAVVLLLLQVPRLLRPAPLGSLRQIDSIDLAVLLFVGYAIFRWITSPAEYVSRLEVLSVIGYATVFFFCRYGIGRRKYGVAILVLLVTLGVGEVIFGYFVRQQSHSDLSLSIGQFATATEMQQQWGTRWLGSYGSPNHYACLLVMAMSAALAIGCFSRFPWPVRIVFFYLAALILVGVVYSQSRGSWFSVLGVVAALVYAGLRHGAVRWWLPLGGGLVLALILTGILVSSQVVASRVDNMRSIVDSHSFDAYLRVALTDDALRIAHDHPLLGTGPGTYADVDPHYEKGLVPVRAVYTHDDYLNCLDDYGLIGFALAIYFFFAVTLALGAKIQPASRWTERVLVAAALMAWCALLVHSFLDFNLHIPANAMLLFGLTGMALGRRPEEDAPFHWSTLSLARLGPLLGWAVLAFALLDGAEALRTALSARDYANALDDADTAPTAQTIQRLDHALQIDPGNVPALIALGDLHRLRAARAEDQKDKQTEGDISLAAYERAWRANPLDDAVQAQAGLTAELLGRDEEAGARLEEAVRAQPHNGYFWMFLGNFYLRNGLFEKSAQAFETAAHCPYGSHGADHALQRIRSLLALKAFLPPDQLQPLKGAKHHVPAKPAPSNATAAAGPLAPGPAPSDSAVSGNPDAPTAPLDPPTMP